MKRILCLVGIALFSLFMLFSCSAKKSDQGSLTSAGIVVGFNNSTAAKPIGTVQNVTSVKVDVLNGSTALVTAFTLTYSGSTWSGTITNLPVGPNLTFKGHAYNAGAVEIFTGTVNMTLTGTADAVVIGLSPIDDGVAAALPKITQIIRPSEVISNQTATITIQIEGGNNETLAYEFFADTNGGVFSTATGSVTLTGTSGVINTTYTAPAAIGTYNHSIRITNNQGNSAETTFDTVVVYQLTSAQVSVQFAPTITSLRGKRVGSDIIWTATVVDDGPINALTYNWSFSGGLSFFDNTVNPATMQGYTPTASGNLVLTVTDHDGTGQSSTLTYALPANQFPNNVVTDGLVAYYPFSGNANDASGNGNSGTVSGATLTADRFGNPNSAYSFDGVNSQITLPIFANMANSVTLSTWFNAKEFYPGQRAIHIISLFGRDSLPWTGAAFYVNNAGFFGYGLGFSDGTNEIIDTTISITKNTWYHGALVYDGTRLRVYLNGSLVGTHTYNKTLSNLPVSSFIGLDRPSGGQYFNGLLDDVRIYKRALSASEIQALYSAASPEGLVAYYPFNGNANDASGHGNNGTVSGATLTTDRFGNPNSAYYFDGVNNTYINASASTIPMGNTSTTLSAWFKVNATILDQYIAGWGTGCTTGTTNSSFYLNLYNGQHRFVPWGNYVFAGNYLLNQWTLFAVTYDGATSKVYINGSLVTSYSGTLNMTNGNGFNIGSLGSCDQQHYFSGSIDDVRIYNRALSASEVQSLYTSL